MGFWRSKVSTAVLRWRRLHWAISLNSAPLALGFLLTCVYSHSRRGVTIKLPPDGPYAAPIKPPLSLKSRPEAASDCGSVFAPNGHINIRILRFGSRDSRNHGMWDPCVYVCFWAPMHHAMLRGPCLLAISLRGRALMATALLANGRDEGESLQMRNLGHILAP